MRSNNCSIDMESEGVNAGNRRNIGLLATWGAVISAILSSACCWLPLFLIAFGASAAGVSGFFEAYRFYLLGATGLLLAVGFYLVYFHKDKCEPGSACATASPGLARFNKMILWIATVFVFLFALFPNYLGLLIGGGKDTGAAVIAASEDRLYRIEGMTCEGCAVNLRSYLTGIPGVIRADVSYEARTAHVFFNNEMASVIDSEIHEAIKRAGYRGFSTHGEKGE